MTADTPLAETLAVCPLTCPVCRRAVPCTPADLRVFAAIGPPACCGRPLALPSVASAPTTVIRARRRPARPGAWAEVRRPGPPAFPNLCIGLVDATADEIGVQLEVQMFPGEAVAVTLGRPGAARPIVVRGVASWCRPAVGGRFLARVRLSTPLTEAEVTALTR